MRKKLARITKWTLLMLALILVLFMFFPTWTPAIKGENSISLYKQVMINGADHQIMIRGEDKRNPVIIFVHGGPGCSEIPYVRKYQKEWEKHYTIVHYDQRGSGKSYKFNEDYSQLTTDVLRKQAMRRMYKGWSSFVKALRMEKAIHRVIWFANMAERRG